MNYWAAMLPEPAVRDFVYVFGVSFHVHPVGVVCAWTVEPSNFRVAVTVIVVLVAVSATYVFPDTFVVIANFACASSWRMLYLCPMLQFNAVSWSSVSYSGIPFRMVARSEAPSSAFPS